MNRNKMDVRWVLTAAIGLTLTGSAFAQFRIGSDGRAHDANNRIGSNGNNDIVGNTNTLQNNLNNLGNQIITDQTTGAKYFRGNVGYSDPNVFQGHTANDISNNFIRQSSGAAFGGVPQNNAQVTQPFYSVGQTTAALPNFARQNSASGALVPQSAALAPGPGDNRLGAVLDTPIAVLPQSGTTFLPGPVTNNTQNILTASPLYGVVRLNANNQADQAFLNSSGNGGNSLSNQLDPTTLQRLRSELIQPPTNNQLNGQDQNNPNNTNGQSNGSQPSSDMLQSTQLASPFESPSNQPIDNRIGNQSGQGQINNAGAFTNDLTTGAQLGNRNNSLMSAERQSTQLTELQKRLQQYKMLQPINGSEVATTAAQKAAAAKTQAADKNTNATPAIPKTLDSNGVTGGAGATGLAKNAIPGVAQPGNSTPLPGKATGAAATATPGMPGQNVGGAGMMSNEVTAKKPAAMGSAGVKPMQIKSLADGVQAKGLAELLKGAEDNARTGKYNAALEQYDMAEAVAPNNPLVQLGQANVELAQSYYSRADGHLRDAFTKNPQLLMGQYDLRNLLGEDRLDFLVKDLKEIAKQDAKQPRPLFLLAYIAYNTGNERQAAGYIDLAEKRAGSGDPIYPSLRQHWALPNESTPEMNK